MNLDLLRALAVCFVVASHLHPLRDLIDDHRYHMHTLGSLGVGIFFVHTCFVLMASLARRGPQARPFFVRRFFRIYPLSLVVVALSHWRAQVSLGMTLSNLALVQNLTGHASLPGPLWSLPFEVQMYLVLPLLFALGGRWGERTPFRLFVLWSAAAGASLLLWHFSLPYHLLVYVPCFLSGVIAFYLPRGEASPMWIFLYVAALALLLPSLVAIGGFGEGLMWPSCLGLGALIARCRELRIPWLGALGKLVARYSYGIYLTHSLAVELAFVRMANRAASLQWAAFFVALATLAFVAYHVVEKPFMAYGERLAQRA